jgi:hypothetical protein
VPSSQQEEEEPAPAVVPPSPWTLARNESIADLFGRLNVQSKDPMFLHNIYLWTEAVPEQDEDANSNIRYRCMTVDALLWGVTDRNQIQAVVVCPDDTTSKTLKITYKPPATYLTSRHTAV